MVGKMKTQYIPYIQYILLLAFTAATIGLITEFAYAGCQQVPPPAGSKGTYCVAITQTTVYAPKGRHSKAANATCGGAQEGKDIDAYGGIFRPSQNCEGCASKAVLIAVPQKGGGAIRKKRAYQCFLANGQPCPGFDGKVMVSYDHYGKGSNGMCKIDVAQKDVTACQNSKVKGKQLIICEVGQPNRSGEVLSL